MLRLVVIDGMSGSGKTTLRSALIETMNFDVLTIDRFSPSIWVYDMLRGIDRTKEIQDFENKFEVFEPLLVLCMCDPEVARERDEIKRLNFTYTEEQNLFEVYYNEITKYKNKIYLDTSRLSLEFLIKSIKEKLNA